MKLKLSSTLMFSFAMFAAHAQMSMPGSVTDAEKTATQSQTVGGSTITKVESEAKSSVGNLISQFSGQISSSSLTDEFNKGKSAFQKQAGSSDDAKANSGLLQKLQAGIKSTAFTAAWAKIKDKWATEVKGATTNKQLANSLKTLSENIDPKSMSATWEKVKPTFTAALAKIK